MTSSPFTLTAFTQDGYAAGTLRQRPRWVPTASSRRPSPTATPRRSARSASRPFPNPEGLRQLGDSKWGSTGISGEALISEANTNGTGLIQSGALEQANVDITEELVALIQAQRNFSANAKAIETSNTMTDTIVNLRT